MILAANTQLYRATAEGAGPTGYFRIYVEFVEGFSDGNIEHPGYDQIQVISKDLSDIYVLKAGDTMTGELSHG